MKTIHFAVVILAMCFSFAVRADVQPGTTTTTNGLMLSTSVAENGKALVVFLHTADPETAKFKLAVAVVLEDGTAVKLRGSVTRFPDDRPGTFWTSVSLEAPRTIARVLNVSVQELKAPRTTDFR